MSIPADGHRAGPAADVGRWFSTAAAPAPARSLPRTPAWGPMDGAEYGRISGPDELEAALDLLREGPVAVLTGAGMSTASGLPDYRGRHAVPRSPMTFQEFTGSDLSRRRYWARSTVGWTQFGRARPNRGHLLLARLGAGPLPQSAVITQNVDGLHGRAGSDPVIDLHGRLDRVRCLSCGARSSRSALHSRMLAMNPELAARIEELASDAAQAPDGDAEVDRTSSFRYPPCPLCGGILKPDVVFFGEAARPETVQAAFAALAAARSLLVLGSSLTVQSGLRFVRAAHRAGQGVVILNDGPTRGDPLATVRLHGRIEDVLGTWAERLGPDVAPSGPAVGPTPDHHPRRSTEETRA
ncbi:NAD-dependent protein deacetylase [Brachybacterium rhamnosum]|uniref:protein acetyllysine N-acetyltransferase n=1 Tax=Brachybacterium rhamnosum TaxID=173361 RepID=A0ABW4PZC0_9MICO